MKKILVFCLILSLCILLVFPVTAADSITYNFDNIEVSYAAEFTATPVSVENDSWFSKLAGGPDKPLQILCGIVDLKMNNSTWENKEEFIKITGANGSERLLANSMSTGWYDAEQGTYTKLKFIKSLFWSAKRLEGNTIVKDFTEPIKTVVMKKNFDEAKNLTSIDLYFSVSDQDFWRDEDPTQNVYRIDFKSLNVTGEPATRTDEPAKETKPIVPTPVVTTPETISIETKPGETNPIVIKSIGVNNSSKYSSQVYALLAKNLEKAKSLKTLNIIQENKKGFELEKPLTKDLATVVAIKLYGLEKAALEAKLKSPFTDVKDTHWAAKYISYAAKKGIITGTNGKTFSPNKQMSGKEFTVLILKGLGYKEANLKNVESTAVSSGILTKTEAKTLMAKKVFTKDDMVLVVYNALKTKIKGTSETLIETLVDKGAITKDSAKVSGLYTEPYSPPSGASGMDKIEAALRYALKNKR